MRYRYVKLIAFIFPLSLLAALGYGVFTLFHINQYRPELEQWFSDKLHRPVTIKQLDFAWDDGRPAVTIGELIIAGKDKERREWVRAEHVYFYPTLGATLQRFKRLAGRIKIAELSLPRLRLDFKNLTGTVSLLKAHIAVEKLEGTWRQLPQYATAKLEFFPDKPSRLALDVHGELSAEALADYLSVERQTLKEQFVRGKTNYEGHIVFSKEDKHDKQLTLNTSLRGMSVHLPESLGKPADVPRPLILILDMKPKNKLPITFKYGRAVEGRLLLVRKPTLRPARREFTLDRGSFRFKELQFYGENFNGLQTSVQRVRKHWVIHFNHPNLLGVMNVPDAANASITGHVKRLLLRVKPKGHHRHVTRDYLHPTHLPNVNITCDRLVYGKITLTGIDLRLRRREGGIKLTRFNVHLPSTDIRAQGSWIMRGKHEWSELSGQIRTSDVGMMLNHWGTGGHLRRGVGAIRFSLNWPGVFYRPNWLRASGALSFKLHDGYIIRIPKQAKADLALLRLIDFFSLSSLTDQFSLKFDGGAAKSATAYDLLQGSFSLRQGNAYTRNLYLLANLFNLKLQGRIGLVNEDFDLILWVHPFVTSDLPVVAATVLGGPIAGAVSWLVDKALVDPIIGEAAAEQFRVTGPWARPSVKKLG